MKILFTNSAILASIVFANLPDRVHAQSFFATLLTDPTVGVERGSASQVARTDKFAKFVTADTFGSEDVGPVVLGFGIAVPQIATESDQLDVVAAIAGTSEDDHLELQAVGLGYRADLNDNGTSLFFQADAGTFRPGTAANLLLGVQGSQSTLGFGVKHKWSLEKEASLTASAELIGRSTGGELLEMTAVEENLRLLRLSLLYQQGIPMVFQRRFAASVTKGFDEFGASSATNPLASSPGVTTDFLRVSASAEFSLPISQKFVVNTGIFGQWTQDSLPVSQRCGYGTNAYARGFDQSFVNGDRCWGGRAELAYNVEVPETGADRLVFTQAYLGLDGGTIIDNANLILSEVEDTWSSVSVGMRSLRGNFLGEISFTKIIDEPAGIVSQDETRIWVRGAVKF